MIPWLGVFLKNIFECLNVNPGLCNCIMMWWNIPQVITGTIHLKFNWSWLWHKLFSDEEDSTDVVVIVWEQANHISLNGKLIWFYYVASPSINQRVYSLVHLDPKQFHGGHFLKQHDSGSWTGLWPGWNRLAAVNHWILRADMGAASQMESRWKGKRMTLRKRPSN